MTSVTSASISRDRSAAAATPAVSKRWRPARPLLKRPCRLPKTDSARFCSRCWNPMEASLRPEDVNAACREGDQAALEIIRSSGQMIGDVLAGLVNFFNPSHIFIGGGITNFGNHLLVAIRRAVLRRSLPLATTQSFHQFFPHGPRGRRHRRGCPGAGISIRRRRPAFSHRLKILPIKSTSRRCPTKLSPHAYQISNHSIQIHILRRRKHV